MAAGMMPGLYGPTGSLRSCFGTRWAALGACTGRVEVLLGMAHSSGQHRSAKHKQNIADDRPGYRRLHDIVEPRTQRSQSDDELRGIAKRSVEESSNPFAQAFCQLFRSSTHPS